MSKLENQLTKTEIQVSNNDIELNSLRDSLNLQKTEIARLKKEVASLDMVRLRYANGRLQLPYDEQKVKEAIELFNGISDISLKEQYREVLYWLRAYGKYLHDVKSLIQNLQNDSRRTNKFDFDTWRKSALKEIENNEYHRESIGHDFSIIYLDRIISAAENRIKRAGKTVDLSDLLERFD